jgi:hypothetical protein
VHQPERQQPFPGSFLLMYAIGSVFSIASKDIVLEDMSEWKCGWFEHDLPPSRQQTNAVH